MKKITLFLATVAATFAMNAQTITATVISSAEVTTDASDVPTSWVLTYASGSAYEVTLSGFAANTSFTFFNQIRNAAGDQFAGGSKSVTTDAMGNATTTFSPGFFGGGTLDSDQTVTWRTNIGTTETVQSFPVTIPSLSSGEFAKGDISSAIGPNPVSSVLAVNVDAETYSLVDLAGKTVLSQAATGSIDVSGLTAGIYLLVTEAGTAKVVVE